MVVSGVQEAARRVRAENRQLVEEQRAQKKAVGELREQTVEAKVLCERQMAELDGQMKDLTFFLKAQQEVTPPPNRPNPRSRQRTLGEAGLAPGDDAYVPDSPEVYSTTTTDPIASLLESPREFSREVGAGAAEESAQGSAGLSRQARRVGGGWGHRCEQHANAIVPMEWRFGCPMSRFPTTLVPALRRDTFCRFWGPFFKYFLWGGKGRGWVFSRESTSSAPRNTFCVSFKPPPPGVVVRKQAFGFGFVVKSAAALPGAGRWSVRAESLGREHADDWSSILSCRLIRPCCRCTRFR